ncbi:protein CASC1 isoform X7 [Pteropus alecto]|uniref:protein CASC1 isoform X7 n=1 Tax=Pteropus alecto TaxID=9402 RepID=UPI000D534CC4|nr:protein CASC1 isoform X7 [Pteropus alecto]
MGPKAKKPGSKKKKITKAERLKLLQEEEERRQKEEGTKYTVILFSHIEEARVKYEKEEMERLEMERIEKEKWQQLEAKDLERRKEELEELYYLEGCFPEAEKLKQENRLLSQWKHYIQCDGSPDPSVAQEINTFISLWKEETNETFEEVIAKSKLVLYLIEKLKLILLETPPYDLQDKNITQYQGSILELQELLHLKFNIATEILLRQASTLADLDSGNMEKVIQDENVTLYVWANLKKNPRYRSVRFSETQTRFELPRILATSDIALRLLHTHYDHVTPPFPVRALSQERTSTEAHFVEGEVNVVETEIPEDFEEEHKQRENESISVHEEEIKIEEQVDTEVQRSSVQEESKATKYELEMKLLSETVSAAQLLLIENTSEKPYFFEDDEVDTCQFTMLGGVYHLDILELPPQCKPVKGWMIMEEDLCMLASIKLDDKKHPSVLEGKWMNPISFIIALKEAGLNIFPTGHSHFYVVINHKVPLVEMKACRQMALLSSAFAFGWSRWNAHCDSKKVVLKVMEHLAKEEPIQNPDWTLLMFSGDRAQRLKIDEYSETFSEALKEETEFHSTLYHMVKDFASKEAMEKIRSSNCQFINSVCHMLLSIRLFSYS